MSKTWLISQMTPTFLKLFKKEKNQGLMLHLRKSQKPADVLGAIKNSRHKSGECKPIQPTDKIVIVGLGIGGITLAQDLYRAGFTNVTCVGKKSDVGGKCVQLGCMPFEYFYKQHIPFKNHEAWVAGYSEFVSQLQHMLSDSLSSIAFPWIEKIASKIERKNVVLDGGTTVPFDHCVIAIGGSQTQSNRENSISIEDFWKNSYDALNIVTDTNPAALSLADCAHWRGTKVKVFFKTTPIFFSTPSFREFKKSFEKRGIEVSTSASSLDRQTPTLYLLQNTPRFVMIDGTNPRSSDIDLVSGTYLPRNDIHFLGDASGLMAASEAEIQAHHLFEKLRTGELNKTFVSQNIEKLPVRLHAAQSLAWVGPMTDFLRDDWRSLDFARIGWSLAHQKTGKLWYCLNDTKTHVSSIHIFHPDASSLIAVAASLIDKPIADMAWQTFSVHPSEFEIFKVVAHDALQQTGVLATHKAQANSARSFKIENPLQNLETAVFLTPEERVLVKLADNPTRTIAHIFAIKKAMELSKDRELVTLSRSTLPLNFDQQNKPTVTIRSRDLPIESQYFEQGQMLQLKMLEQEITVSLI